MKKIPFYIAIFPIFLLTISIVCVPRHSVAQTFQNKYNNWEVYTVNKNGEKLCYMVAFPIKKSGNYHYRSEPYAMLTSINGNKEEFSVTGGYKYKPGTEPRTIIDGKKYKLSLTADENAWFKTEKYNKLVIKKMKKGMKLKVIGTSTKGTYSIDTYSLRGFTKAYKAVKSLCKNGRHA